MIRWVDGAMTWLIEAFDLGLFTFRELTRGISWTLAWPEIMQVLTYSDIGKGLVASLCIAFIGIIADRLIGGWSAKRKAALGLA